MDGALKLWTVILVVGALNYASRLSFIAFFAQRSMPPLLARALKYVPAAMLTALVVPMLVVPVSLSAAPSINPRIVAAVVATVVAFVTRGTLHTIGAGMVTLWLLRWVAG
jgi:branched-subunit amino acid transport protein